MRLTGMHKKLAVIAAFIVLQASCVNYELVRTLDLDSGWYHNIFGTPVLYGTITNKGSEEISDVVLNVTIRFCDGTSVTKKVYVSKCIKPGGQVEFKEWITGYDKDVSGISACIYDAW